ncbi:MAG: hypothetical protein IKU17_04175 [Clostridia bacterium]|nr:hypothetical protein [Clostridia bacterium]
MISNLKRRFLNSDFCRVFNFRTPESTGSSLLLINTFTANLANTFVTGIFYTAFLAQNGIDIVRVGIIAFIPYISWLFGLISPKVLRLFKRRRALLLFNHIFYYLCIVLATTIMPIFVKDYLQRTIWFGVFQFLASAMNAVLGSGAMAWHIHFVPKADDARNIYFSFQNLTSSFISTLAAVFSAIAADALAASGNQETLIVVLRYVAFGLFVFGGTLVYAVPKEWPYEFSGEAAKFKDIITLPLQHKKFFLCCILCFFWNFIAATNASTWNYYLLDTVKMPYLMTLTTSIFCVFGNVFLLRFWRRLIARFTWHRMLLFWFIIAASYEVMYSFTTSQTLWWYVIVSVYCGIACSGLNLTYANLFYINLPKGDQDVYYLFWNFGANILAFCGAAFGTFFLSIFQQFEPVTLFGLPFYGSQFLPLCRFVLTMLMCLFIWKITPLTQPDEEN